MGGGEDVDGVRQAQGGVLKVHRGVVSAQRWVVRVKQGTFIYLHVRTAI